MIYRRGYHWWWGDGRFGQVYTTLKDGKLEKERKAFLDVFMTSGFGCVEGSKWEHIIDEDVLRRAKTFVTEDRLA